MLSDWHDEIESMHPPNSFAQDIVRQLAWHGVVALSAAVVLLAVFRGFDPGVVVGYGMPVIIALVSTSARYPATVRLSAWTFLVGIGIGVGIAHVPQLFPKLGGVAPQLPQWLDRLLTWYAGLCAGWGAVAIPFQLFAAGLQMEWISGKPPQGFRTLCYIGLVVVSFGAVLGFPEWITWLHLLPLF
jgi:hypothetical protein